MNVYYNTYFNEILVQVLHQELGQQPIKTKQSLPTAPMDQSTNAADILNFIILDNLKYENCMLFVIYG